MKPICCICLTIIYFCNFFDNINRIQFFHVANLMNIIFAVYLPKSQKIDFFFHFIIHIESGDNEISQWLKAQLRRVSCLNENTSTFQMVKQPKGRSSHRFGCIPAGSAARPLWSAAPRWRLQARRPAAGAGRTAGTAGCSERSCGSVLHWDSWWTTHSVAGRSRWLRRAAAERSPPEWPGSDASAEQEKEEWIDMHVWKMVKWDNG